MASAAPKPHRTDWIAPTDGWAVSTPTPRGQASSRASTRIDRARRERHLRRRRRDLLLDLAVALTLTIVVISITAGLGVVLLLEIPAWLVLLATFVRGRRRRRAITAGASRRRRPPERGARTGRGSSASVR